MQNVLHEEKIHFFVRLYHYFLFYLVYLSMFRLESDVWENCDRFVTELSINSGINFSGHYVTMRI